jgi:response regulator NasT
MESLLIASNTSSGLALLSELFKMQTFSRIVTTTSGGEARRFLRNDDADLVIIESPLSDEPGDDLALHASEHRTGGVILVTPVEALYALSNAVEGAGVFVLPKPMTPELFYQAVKHLRATRERVLKLEDENRLLQKKLQEIKVIDRAKCVLIQYLNMTETQAHRYIEQQSMDLRQSKLETAENILKTYDN